MGRVRLEYVFYDEEEELFKVGTAIPTNTDLTNQKVIVVAKGKDPQNKQSIINFLQNQWIEKNRIDVFMDKSDIRNTKIDKILS